ncbi:MAG: flagellar hook assembly protein FlgD [Hyphomonadaceae bacterium]|jgi:flagellar basal-body rod modification protein FlgD|nr:flagellar hook assembly protein FlgD [Hyphomonadaceae bacterium]
MDVSAVTNKATSDPAASKSTDVNGASVDYNAFLKLLIAQMKNQDPTKPMDSAQFMAQLASFSNVEQGVKMNQKLDSLMTSLALSQADGVLGRTVVSADGKVSGKVAALNVITGGAVAVLEDGREVVLGPGVKIK